MTSRTQRMYLYTCVCLVLRVVLVYLVFLTKKNAICQKLAAVISVFIGLSFLRNYCTKKEFGFFGGKIWWKQLRLLHAFLFLLFAILVFNGYQSAYSVLIPGIVFGMMGFIQNYF